MISLMWIEIHFYLKYLENCTRNVFSLELLGMGSREVKERKKGEGEE